MADIYFRPDGQNRFQIRSAANGTLPSAWLDQEFNRIYTYLNSIEGGGSTTGSEWAEVNAEGTQVSTTSFSIKGDYSNVFEALRAIEITDDSYVKANSHIKSSTYVAGTNTTTVVLYDAIVPETIKAISVGLISSEAQPIPSFNYTTRSSAYTVGASDQIILVNDSTIGNLTLVYDDGQVNGNGYYALLITLPVAGDMPGKLLCVKKISGTYQTIVSSSFTHTTSTVGTDTVHTNTYTFQVYGDTEAKNRVTLKGIGDCYWFFSNGSRWYEITPEASETVKGIVRLATEEEMSLTAQQIADGETLSRTLAVSPYQVEKAYLRTDASNMHFSSSYIYKTPNITGLNYGTAAYLDSGNVTIPQGVGITIPDGRDENGVGQTLQIELSQNYTTVQAEASSKKKTLFVVYDKTSQTISLKPFFSKNVYYGYYFSPTYNLHFSDEIAWFNYATNTWLYYSSGTNWTTLYGVPICEFWGNGTNVTTVKSFSPVGFATRDNISLVTTDYIIDQFCDGNATGFRLWKSGLLENWGQTIGSGNTFTTFYKPFSNTYYNIVGGTSPSSQRGGTHWYVNRTQTGFYLTPGYGDVGYNTNRGEMWYHAFGAQSES